MSEPDDASLDLAGLAAAVGGPDDDPVAPTGSGSRGPLAREARRVQAPGGIVDVQPAEMTVRCGAGTQLDVLAAELAPHGQEVALPPGGTVGGALAAGESDILRLGRGPVRDVLLQARYVSAAGEVVRAGGPTVKNVSGFDVCRLLVGSKGTLGVLGEVILRTRPLPPCRRWFSSDRSPSDLLVRLHRPSSLLWDGQSCWVCLEGHEVDVDTQARAWGLDHVDGPPPIPTAHRSSVPPTELLGLAGTGVFVAEVGVGIVHHADVPAPERPVDPALGALQQRVRLAFDPTGRLNPGVVV